MIWIALAVKQPAEDGKAVLAAKAEDVASESERLACAEMLKQFEAAETKEKKPGARRLFFLPCKIVQRVLPRVSDALARSKNGGEA